MSSGFYDFLSGELKQIEADGLYKRERIITSEQFSEIDVNQDGEDSHVINFCANNYLGLANRPELIEAAKATLDTHGFGVASVRFICGTQDIHKQLEAKIAEFTGCEDAILYAAAFDANGGVFEPLLGPEDAIISDALNHASIIDGVRLCKAKRYRYANSDMDALEDQLKQARADGCRHILIVTDGVFSMDGYIAKLPEIVALAEKYDALTMVDDCHAHGFMGAKGRGTPEHCGVFGKIDIVTGTLGKALGGAMGGFTAGRKEVIDMLRQRSRPYLFSNSLAPSIVGASLKALDMVNEGDDLRARLFDNAKRFRAGMSAAGFDLLPGEHPIIPVMLGDAALSQQMASKLMEEGVYVIGFFYPVVPKGQARIRTQMSAAHTPDMIDRAVAAFTKVGKDLGVI
ncbi:MAG: glycine C-acetyltransferase [Maricaulis sp.]|uniref:glycine C-acetyltransferase n=1 Tax=Maricaulis sp. TaxID=1486257 RepID=UPI001B2E5483|nr:glycine C-acetyltransferase [Maricaulis sp.]MBO6730679.1 glycine C-acetyltransferase [Maricaulis sp.]MBO6847396.1 glycine C-acetyltransferase [Maricaulis sp.]MBO6876404.1 glycine C-acetyltransferase [Maricaulis sp.]MDM7983059.1 glycine C-acetyltransferase [Maricaulis sp.]